MLSRIRLPLIGKIFAICFVLASVVSLGGSWIIYHGASSSLREEVRSRLKSAAAIAALQVDPGLHESIRTQADESTHAYRQVKSALIGIRASYPGIRYVYTMRKTAKPHTWQFVVDAEQDPKNMSHVGDEYDVSEYPEMRSSYDRPAADQSPEEDKWGTWLSGYAPIRDSSGRTIGILGMDMSLSQLRQEEASLRSAMIRNIIVGVLLCVLMGMLFAKALMKPITALTKAAGRVSSGDLNFQIGMRGSDELGKLTRSFDQMLVSLAGQSNRDFLTGLFNYTHFREALQNEIDQAARYQQELSLLVLDLDRFKEINDTLGQEVGNGILYQVGTLLKESLRGSDIAARYSGDEFAVILPNSGEESSKEVAERIRGAVESRGFYAMTMEDILARESVPTETRIVRLTCTIGMACYPRHHKMRDGLVMAADIALFRAKNVARNSVYVCDESNVQEESRLDPQVLYTALHDANSTAIQSLAAAVDAKDRYTSGHSERVANYATAIAEQMGLSKDMQDTLRVAGLLHDLGKIGVPDAILNKSGRLTQEEREVINRHPTVGGDILKRSPHLDRVLPGVVFHHERYDGAGYPDGLAGDGIPLIARVLAVADSFDAMTSERPYRKAMPVESALRELKNNAGTQFAPDVVEAFLYTMSHECREAA